VSPRRTQRPSPRPVLRRAPHRAPHRARAVSRHLRAALLLLPLVGAACLGTTEPGTGARDLRGAWRYTADQVAPTLQLSGDLVIETQRGGEMAGRLAWEERDGSGAVTVTGGALTGLMLGTADVDFDVLLAGGARRHVGRLVADTMTGSWVEPARGRSGSFRAVRTTTASAVGAP
jgi:hypothetical protein